MVFLMIFADKIAGLIGQTPLEASPLLLWNADRIIVLFVSCCFVFLNDSLSAFLAAETNPLAVKGVAKARKKNVVL